MENWKDIYLELIDVINDKMPEIKWIDMWHEQVSYLTSELPFPTPAIFLSFNVLDITDESQLVQDCDIQIDFRLFYETFSDTYGGSYNQDSALSFLEGVTKIHTTFHGTDGESYGTLKRVAVKEEESGGAGNLYRVSFSTMIKDSSAQKEYNNTLVNDISISNESIENIPLDVNTHTFIID